MAGPGGPEVGRVSVKVVPDSDGFGRELRDQLRAIERSLQVKIPVKFDVDTTELRATLDALETNPVRIDVELDLDDALVRAQLQSLDNETLRINVELGNIDVGEIVALRAALQGLQSRDINLRINITGVQLAITQLRVLDAIVARLDGRAINININIDGLAAALAQLAAFTALIRLLGSLGSGSGGGGGGGLTALPGTFGLIATAISAVVSGLVTVVKLGALSFVVAAAGAAITAAWGAAATAIAAVPGVIALLGAPIGAVLLGMDGIKKAAEALKKPFEQLKKDISGAFEQELEPAFERLASIMPKISGQMQEIAFSISKVAAETLRFVASGPGVAFLNSALENTALALSRMTPGITAAVEGFLLIAAQGGAFDAITAAVNTFGEAFRNSVTKLISEGTLASAFKGLEGLLVSLTNGFVSLVENGIKVFAAAAPGVKVFTDELTAFFNRFDWNALGAAVGNVFKGLGETLAGVPTSTIDAIQQAFQRLGDVFADARFQAALQDIISLIPAVINTMSSLIGIAAAVGQAFAGLVSVVVGSVSAIRAGFDLLSGAITFDEFIAKIATAGVDVSTGMAKIGEAAKLGWAAITGSFTSGATGAAGVMRSATQEAFLGVGEAATTGSAAGFRAAEEASKKDMIRFRGVIDAELKKLPQEVTQSLAGLGPQIQQAFTGLDTSVTAGMTAMNTAVVNGTVELGRSMTTGLQGLGETVRAAFAGLAPFVIAGMFALQTSINASLLQIRESFRVGLEGLGVIAQTAFANLAPFVTAGMFAIQVAINTSLLAIRESFRVGFEGFGLIAQTAFANLAPFVTAGMFAIQVAINTSLLAIRESFRVGLEGLVLIAQTAFVGLVPVVTAAMAQLQAAVVNGSVEIGNALLRGQQVWVGIVTTAGTLMATAMTTGLANVGAAATAGLQAVTDSIGVFGQTWVDAISANTAVMAEQMATGMAAIVAAATTGMSNVQIAINTGMIASRQSIDVGVRGMVAALQAAVPQFRAAGANMGQALADGLNSKAGVVEAAARRLAAAAAAAMRAAAQIRSPSRVFMNLGDLMGQGLAVGLENSETHIISAARSIVDGLSTEFGRTDSLSTPTVDKWAAGVNSGVGRTVSASNSALTTPTPAGRSAAVGTINVYNPVAERASNSIARKQRELAELGVFGA